MRDVDFIVRRINSDDRWYCVEVKVDTRALDTGNLAYEVISHGCNGWSVITQADDVFIVLAKEIGVYLNPIKALWVDMNKWKEYCSNRNTPKKMNIIVPLAPVSGSMEPVLFTTCTPEPVEKTSPL